MTSPLWQILAFVAEIRENASHLSINTLLPEALYSLPPQDRPLAQALLYQCLRQRAKNAFLIASLAQRAPTRSVYALLEVAFSAMTLESLTDFTVVNETVKASKHHLKTQKASGFINAILRRYLRQKVELDQKAAHRDDCRFNAPQWWIDRIRQCHPQQAESILTLATRHPPLTLRINTQKTSLVDFQQQLAASGIVSKQVGKSALCLSEGMNVNDIPGFKDGLCSVQDAGAQLAAEWLPISPGDRVLDACAAPGGKTAHLLERFQIQLTSLEIDPKRAERIRENLHRLNLSADVKVADGTKPTSWWDHQPYDAIVLDAPCTASGVTRRQPDTPWLRRPQDIKHLAEQQKVLLKQLWPLLKVGGHLLYVTCSIFPEEGTKQIQTFLANHTDAKLKPLFPSNNGMMVLLPQEQHYVHGQQLPSVNDGFFYALIEKTL